MDGRPKSLTDRVNAIEGLVLDVDGVLSNGQIVYTDDDTETKCFHVRDGSGLKLWRLGNKRVAIITGRTSQVVDVRAAELGISPVVQGAGDKRAGWRHILEMWQMPAESVAAIGDDIPDLPLLSTSGLAIAVGDACPEVRAAAHLVTRANGGHGAVREAIEWILRGQGRWHPLITTYLDVKG